MMQSILLVDDDDDLVLMAIGRLFSRLGYQVVCANSGQRALEILQTQEVSVLITDHLMPGMTGLELIQRASECSPQTPTILMSGLHRRSLRDAGAHRQADAILSKPFDIDEAMDIINRLMDASQRNPLS